MVRGSAQWTARHVVRSPTQAARNPPDVGRVDSARAAPRHHCGRHADRCAALGDRALDDRTWADLDLDDVFVALDRTTSTLGQHALYHRLRTAPVGPHLEEFETLVERLRRDAAPASAPARAVPAAGSARLRRLVARRRGRVRAAAVVASSRSLTAVTVTLAMAALFWPAAVVALVAMVALNMAVRYATDERTLAIARSFRQLAPLIATAQ